MIKIRIVLIITRADDLGGAQSHVRDLAIALSGRGEEVYVAAGGSGPLADALSGSCVKYIPLKRLVHPIRPFFDLAAFLETRKVLKRLKPDLVTTHSNKAGLIGRMAAGSLRISNLHTSHGWLFTGKRRGFKERFYRLAERFAARCADGVICVAESEYQLALSLKVIPEEKLTVIYNGIIDLGEDYCADPALQPPVLITVARFADPKDYPTLLKALAALKEKAWSLKIVGDGAGRADAERLAAELKIKERVSFLKMRTDVDQLLKEASLFVLSSKREGFPISILEAMRAGLPVVASRVGGVGEAVADGETGFLFEAGSAEELSGKLAPLLADPALRLKLGKAGRRRYLKHFTLDKMVEQTWDYYLKIKGRV